MVAKFMVLVKPYNDDVSSESESGLGEKNYDIARWENDNMNFDHDDSA